MEEQLSRKRRVRAGHRASVCRIISQVYENMEGSDDPERKLSKARQQDNALKEKLQVLRTLDSEILELTVADDDVVEEIQKADEYAERLQLALIDLERVLKESKSRPSSPGVRQPETVHCLRVCVNQKTVHRLRVGDNQKAVNQECSDKSR